MFDKLKQISELKKLQDRMKEERVEVVKNGVKAVINGKFEVENIILNEELNCEEQARILKDCLNEAVKDVQMKIAQNFSHLM